MNQARTMRPPAAPGQSAVTETLRSMILSGAYPPGSRLPTREILVEQTGASSATLQRALDQLAHHGLVRTVPRQGTFVDEHPPYLAQFGLLFSARSQSALRSLHWSMMAREAMALHHPPHCRTAMYFDIETDRASGSLDQLRSDAAQHLLAGLIVSDIYRMRGVVAELGLPSVALCTRRAIEQIGLPHVLGLDLDFGAFMARSLEHLARRRRRRVAVLVESARPAGDRSEISTLASEYGLKCPPHWVLGVDHRAPHWVQSVLELLMAGSDRVAPDALIISDDHLVEATLHSLLRLGRGEPGRLEIVAHCNFPAPPLNLLPVVRLGYDIRVVLERAMELIRAVRLGGDPPRCTTMAPVFEPAPEHAR